MRVLHIVPSIQDSASGMDVAVAATITSLRAAGVTVEVASPGTQPSEACLVSDVRLTPLCRIPGLGKWRYAYGLSSVAETAFSDPPDVVHAHGLWLYPQWLAASLARRWQRPLVVTLHGMLEPWRRRHHRWRKSIAWQLSDRRILQSAAAWIATSKQEAANLRRCAPSRMIAVVPVCLTVPPWVRDAVGTTPWLGRQENNPRIALFLSRIHPAKGLEMLVKAVARLRPADWRFVVAGPDAGGQVAALKCATARAGVEGWFDFTGPVYGDDKWRTYQKADLFVLPSYNENFGLAVAEALAAGLPVITTTGTPWVEVVARDCGWICEPNDGGLAAALGDALRTPSARLRQMGARGAAWVQDAFSSELHARRHVDLYREILSATR